MARAPLQSRYTIAPGLARAAALCAALLCAGCSTLSGVADPDEDFPTGSITPAAPASAADPLEELIDPADKGALLTALGAALDPQGPGAAVDWTSAGRRAGEAQATGAAKMEGDEVCRPFAARSLIAARPFSATGVACRNKRGDWRVREIAGRKSG